MSGFAGIAKAISDDLKVRLPEQRATQRRKLSELSAGMLVCQTPNLMELSNVLDRPSESAEASAIAQKSSAIVLDSKGDKRSDRV
jgi:hypothetical protein